MVSSEPPIVYEVQESTGPRDGLSVVVFVAATIDAAKQLADEEAGRYQPAAGPWYATNMPVGEEWTCFAREVPGLGWQHISPTHLYGAAWVTTSPASCTIKEVMASLDSYLAETKEGQFDVQAGLRQLLARIDAETATDSGRLEVPAVPAVPAETTSTYTEWWVRRKRYGREDEWGPYNSEEAAETANDRIGGQVFYITHSDGEEDDGT